MKLSLVITVLNEKETVGNLIDSIAIQSKLPQEIIFVDGGSKDNTTQIIIQKSKEYSKLNIRLIKKKGSIPLGRNEGISKALGDIILSTDAGCILDKNWIKIISDPLIKSEKIDVVAGYYKGLARSDFQKSLIPYVLVMEDKANKDFLPATRSMAFRKSVWQKIGGFNENLKVSEDYVFSLKLKEQGYRIKFERNAIVFWIPRSNLKEAFVMFFRFASGDVKAGIIRDKVLLIFARYLFYLYLISLSILIKSPFLFFLIFVLPIIYISWSINKNYKYIKDTSAFYFLPILQIISDLAVLGSTVFGIIRLIIGVNYIDLIRKNLMIIVLIGIYAISLLSVIASGIPNKNHPFPYQMDEWHQFLSVKNVFKYGTPNLSGSANGTMFHFFISGVLIVPFYILKVIDPFIIKSAVDSLHEQEKLFILLRLITLFFGILTLLVVSKIAKLLKVNSNLAVLLFFVTPMWLSLSNFFKYDIALVFWITLSLYFLIKYHFSPTLKNFILGSFFSGVAFSVKVTGLTMLPVIVLAYLLLTPIINRKYSHLLLGLSIFVLTSIFLGLPDIVFGNGNMYLYLYDNIIGINYVATNFLLGTSLFKLNFLHKFPGIFGHALYLVTGIVIFYQLIFILIGLIYKKYKDLKLRLFIFLSFLIFLFSLFSLGLFITANRAIILLPFVVVLVLLAFKDLLNFLSNRSYLKFFIIIILSLLLFIQIFESYLWLGVKNSSLPQQSSSKWILSNIPVGSTLGLENIPIYQFEPDLVTKEFYNKQYYPNSQTRYNYSVINSEAKNLPKYIIISNVNFEHKYLKMSSKNDLVGRLKNERYTEVAYFPLKIPYYSFFDSSFDYPFMGLTTYPQSISVFKKDY